MDRRSFLLSVAVLVIPVKSETDPFVYYGKTREDCKTKFDHGRCFYGEPIRYGDAMYQEGKLIWWSERRGNS